MAEYRIVTDAYAGFEVQVRRWWWPFWVEADGSNTNLSIEQAEAYARHHAAGRQRLVKHLGRLQ